MVFEKAMSQFTISAKRTPSVAAAQNDRILRPAVAAHAPGLATPIICGNEHAIKRMAEERGLNITPFATAHAVFHCLRCRADATARRKKTLPHCNPFL